MRLTHLGHACLLVDVAGERVLIDPGTLARGFETVRDLGVIVVTHAHPDHLDPVRLPSLVAANPGARVLCDPGSVEVLHDLGVQASAHDGPTVLGALTISPVGETHALIHEDIPLIPNVGVVLRADGEPTLFHPGDSLEGDPGPVDIVAFPLNAPWQRSREMTDFLRRLDPTTAVPIHDGLLSADGRGVYLGHAERLGGEHTRILDLAARGAVEVTA